MADNLNLNEWVDNYHDAWIDDWNNIIRETLFKDYVLKALMKLPDSVNIIDFIDHYFIRAGYTNAMLTDESVRIIYGTYAVPTNVSGVTKNQMSFDIYVKNEDLHNVGTDRLVMRTQLIARRIIYLLTKSRYNGVYRFYDPFESDMGTSAIGYSRYNVTLSYTRAS